MNPQSTTLDRHSLYEEVWTTPVTKVSAKYGLSDNGLRKVCQSLDIPLPPRGYWAKLAAGHKLGRQPLPNPDQTRSVVAQGSPQPERRAFQTTEDDEWLAAALAEEAARPPIAVDPHPKRWHPALHDLKTRLEEAAAKTAKAIREYEREEARRAQNPRLASQPNFSALEYHFARSSGGILLHTHKASAIRVSSGTYQRALALLNAVFYAAEQRGAAPSHDLNAGRFALSLGDAHLHFAVRERMEDAWRDKVNSWTKKVEKEKYTAPTGRLFIATYRNGWDAKQHSDDPEGDFGDLSQILFQPLYYRVVYFREMRREQADRERRQELYRQEVARVEQRRAQQEAEQREKERLSAIEQAKVDALIAEARSWENSRLIRAYLAARAEEGAPSNADWLRWAQEVADRLDATRCSR